MGGGPYSPTRFRRLAVAARADDADSQIVLCVDGLLAVVVPASIEVCHEVDVGVELFGSLSCPLVEPWTDFVSDDRVRPACCSVCDCVNHLSFPSSSVPGLSDQLYSSR